MWVVRHAEAISALIGIVGAVFLAAPLILEVGERKRLDKAVQAEMRLKNNDDPSSELAAKMRERLVTERLGGYGSYTKTIVTGLVLLGVSATIVIAHLIHAD